MHNTGGSVVLAGRLRRQGCGAFCYNASAGRCAMAKARGSATMEAPREAALDAKTRGANGQ